MSDIKAAAGGTARQAAQLQQAARGVQAARRAETAAKPEGTAKSAAVQAEKAPAQRPAAQYAGAPAESAGLLDAKRAAEDAANLYEEAQKRAQEAFAPEEAEVKSLVEMMKEAKERADEQRERFKLPKNTRYGDAPMEAYSRIARARTQAQAGSAAGYARSKIAQLQSAMRQDPDNADRIRAAIRSLQKAVSRAGKKKRDLQREQLTERQRAKAAQRRQKQKALRLRRELAQRRTMRSIRENGYLRECEVENRQQDQLQASRMELRLQMQQLTESFLPSPEAVAQQYAAQAAAGSSGAAAAPAPAVDVQA